MVREREKNAEEQGSAMVISVLVSAILSLLGISYLLMADTENKIAENEKLSAQALYFGEATVREVKRWFDRPPYVTGYTKNLVRPLTTTMIRTQRWIDTDGDGPTAAVAADGTALKPYYKVGVDTDADGNDDIFDKPYRSALADMTVGVEDHPDILIDRSASSMTTFLDGLRDKIAPNFPAASQGITARINQIQIYEPPYLDVGGTWSRYGMATVKVTVEILRGSSVVATRVVKAVLNETPFPGPFGPLHSCDDLNWNGDFHVHWGTTTAAATADPKANSLPNSIPRSPTVVSPMVDLLNGWSSPADDAIWTAMKTGLEAGTGTAIQDPWWRLMSNGVNADHTAIMTQQINAPAAVGPDYSNEYHRLVSAVGCPEFAYQTWKDIANSGGSDVHYYAWSSGASFTEGGTGAVTDMRTATDNKTGVFFFDTMDQNPPDPAGTNLTPEIDLSGGTYGTRGMVYLNAYDFSVSGLAGRPIDMIWPGEPFRDTNQNGTRDAGEAWINLNYNAISTTDPTVSPKALGSDDYGNAGLGQAYNKYGPSITGQSAIVWGVLYTSGYLDAAGNAWFYGSVVTKKGTIAKMTGTPDMWWDPRLKDKWPPPDWDLPRVIITRWQTDL